MARSEPWSWTKEVLPFAAMLMIICLDMGLLTIVKAAMNGGMNSFVYIVYHNALGTLILLPFFSIHIFRSVGRPPLTFHVLFRFFILGLLGICLFQVLLYIGIGYSSPTMESAISNLIPGYTFLIAVAFRMEKIDLRNSASRAKLFGTIVAILGTMVFTFYKGREIFESIIPSSDSQNQLLLSQPADWVFGGLILVISALVASVWKVLQAVTAREYPDQFTIVFFFCLFGTIQSTVFVLFLQRNPSAWVVQPGIGMVAIVFGAVFSTVFRNTAITWCLRKKGPVFVAMFSPLSIVIASIMGVTFLGDSLHLGSAIGAVIIATGFYSVMFGQANEKKTEVDLGVADERGISQHTAPLLSSPNPNVNLS